VLQVQIVDLGRELDKLKNDPSHALEKSAESTKGTIDRAIQKAKGVS
jgi:hypothetical protein